MTLRGSCLYSYIVHGSHPTVLPSYPAWERGGGVQRSSPLTEHYSHPVQVAFATNDAKTTLHWSPSSSIILASNKIKVINNGTPAI
jgi:hypothetical protein